MPCATTERRLRVAVVGAGIAGLATAAALARQGLRCTLFEQAAGPGEAGAGIQLAPNATRLLHRLGLARYLREVGVRPAAIEMRHWHDDSLIARTELGGACEAEYGAPYYTLLRTDLHKGLSGVVGGIAPVRYGRRCVAVAQDAGRVRLEFTGGPAVTAPLAVGADGIRSAVRAALAPDEPRFAGLAVYRGLVHTGRLPRAGGPPAVRIWLGPGQHCVCYPVAGGRLLNLVAVVPARSWGAESWTEPGDPAELAAAYAGWHGRVREVLAAAGPVTRWALYDRPPVAHLHTGRVVLAGDAAHPVLPFGAQGANQAIEDAFALAACLGGAGRDGVPAALCRYARLRLPRLARVAGTVRDNAASHHAADGPDRSRRDRELNARQRLHGQRWLYGYDVERAAGAEGGTG